MTDKVLGPAEPVFLYPPRPKGAHHSVILTTTTSYSPSDRPAGTDFLLVQTITQNTRFTLTPDSVPTTATGFRLLATDSPLLIPMTGDTLPRFIAETAGAVLQYQWMK